MYVFNYLYYRYAKVLSFVFTRKSSISHQAKRMKRGKNLSPRNRKECHSISTALLQSIAEIGTQSAMKGSRKTLHELSPHISQKTYARNFKIPELHDIAPYVHTPC
jgi:hypothetical protein